MANRVQHSTPPHKIMFQYVFFHKNTNLSVLFYLWDFARTNIKKLRNSTLLYCLWVENVWSISSLLCFSPIISTAWKLAHAWDQISSGTSNHYGLNVAESLNSSLTALKGAHTDKPLSSTLFSSSQNGCNLQSLFLRPEPMVLTTIAYGAPKASTTVGHTPSHHLPKYLWLLGYIPKNSWSLLMDGEHTPASSSYVCLCGHTVFNQQTISITLSIYCEGFTLNRAVQLNTGKQQAHFSFFWNAFLFLHEKHTSIFPHRNICTMHHLGPGWERLVLRVCAFPGQSGCCWEVIWSVLSNIVA